MGKVNSSFGDYLRGIRTKRKETLADVSGAVEIDVAVLDRIESGSIQPSEDVLLLLISYYNLKEDEAIRLWQLAGYEQTKLGAVNVATIDDTLNALSVDSPILFTDGIQVSANKFGVIINFLQGLGVDGKPTSVSRLGMSREHAQTIIEVLNKTLELSKEQNTNING
jgi:transcriptional regulator with XRE-family HTH domain